MSEHKQLTDTYMTSLREAANSYRAAGYTVMPVWGALRSGKAAKRPIGGWQALITARPTNQQHDGLFAGRYGGLALIMGRVSGVIALDLDKPDMLAALIQTAPDLVNTYTVKTPTRGGYHLYYRLAPSLSTGAPVVSRAGVGGELKADGTYILAPPTVLPKTRGVRYQVVNEAAILTINQTDLDRLYSVVGQSIAAPRKIQPSAARVIAARAAVSTEASATVQPCPQQLDRRGIDRLDLSGMFHRKTIKHNGRNNGLYRAAIYARSRGVSLSDTTARLTQPFMAAAPLGGGYLRESEAARYRELLTTVKSAYAAPDVTITIAAPPASTLTGTPDSDTGTLPNRIREALLAAGLAPFARLYEAVCLGGVTAGGRVTVGALLEAAQTAGLTLSRRQVTYGLEAAGRAGLMYRAAPVSHAPTPLHTVYSKAESFVHNSTVRGRRAFSYVWPSVSDLIAALDLPPLGMGALADSLDTTDLQTARSYRRGVHIAFARRHATPAQTYTRRWLSARVGVSVRTLLAYERVTITDQTTGQRQTVRLIQTAVARRETPIASTHEALNHLTAHALFDSPISRKMVRGGVYVTVTHNGISTPIAPDMRRVMWYLTNRPDCRLALVEVTGVKLLGVLSPAVILDLDRRVREAA